VIRLLRIEAAALALLLAALLWQAGPPWPLVVAVLIAPDLSFAGYLAGPRRGALVYNAVHSVVGPVLVAGFGLATGGQMAIQIAGLWGLHIAIDRALGYGLKLPEGFGHTHLGRLGR
jgi:hypothetical protein